MKRYPTALEIQAARTPKGGFTRNQLAKWGVPWPPPTGWRKALLKDADKQDRSTFVFPLNDRDLQGIRAYLPRLEELHRDAVKSGAYWAGCYEAELLILRRALQTGRY